MKGLLKISIQVRIVVYFVLGHVLPRIIMVRLAFKASKMNGLSPHVKSGDRPRIRMFHSFANYISLPE